MRILDYDDAVVDPMIRRIRVDELALNSVVEETGKSIVFRGYFEGNEVAVKIPSVHNFPGFLRVETNALHALQEVTAVPHLYGHIDGDPVITLGIPEATYSAECGTVIEYAAGKPIMSVDEYVHREKARAWHRQTKMNIYDVIAEQLSKYIKGGLERELFDCDFPDRDIFVAVEGNVVKVTKIDLDYVQNRRDVGYGDFEIEIIPNKYKAAIKGLLALLAGEEGYTVMRRIGKDDEQKDTWKRIAERYKAQGLVTFPALVESHINGEFDTDTFKRRFPDDVTFLLFLDRWRAAMKEFGEYFVS